MMTDSVTYDQNNMVGGGEVMEVMMTGGDGGEMNEDTLAQVVNMLQMEGQLTGGNHTIIIRQPGSSEIQMIQTTNNGGELIVSKASDAEIQALQASNGILENVGQNILETEEGEVVMMDTGENLVEGVVQMQSNQAAGGEVMQLTQDGQLQSLGNAQNSSLIEVSKNSVAAETSRILDGLVQQMDGVGPENIMGTPAVLHTSTEPTTASSSKPITISTTTSKPRPKPIPDMNGEVVSIKINTGISRKKENKPPRISPKNVIKISTVTGQQKYQPPKFHKCEACAINFVSRVAYMNHMENCPSKRKTLSTVTNKSNITYTCVFCETKFTSRLVLMQHVRTCDKAKSSKSASSNSKLKVTTSESKLKVVSSVSLPKSSKNSLFESDKKPKKLDSPSIFKEGKGRIPLKKKEFLDSDDEPFPEDKEELDSGEEDEKNIVYDDDEDDDLIDEDLMDDENIEESIVNRRSQKHLGPIIVKGMFKCRDCNRTFSKEYQYNRHVKACTNAPLNSARIDADSNNLSNNTIPVSAVDAVPMLIAGKRKRGRPPLKDYATEDGRSPAKKRALSSKIVAVNSKKIGAVRGRPKLSVYSDNESDEDILDYLTGSSRIKDDVIGKKNSKLDSKSSFHKSFKSDTDNYSQSASSLSKIVKISPSDTLIKQTGKAMLSKINREKYSKYMKDTPFCGLCGDKFKSTQELSLHTQISHSEDLLNLRDSLDGKGNLSAIKCPLCDLHFMSPHILLLHMVSFHDKELRLVQEELENQNLNLVCPFCKELSLTQDLLKEHMATKHLDKLINKPSTTMSPMAIDVHAFIKEKNNGSILPTGKLLAKKEKVLCPECGLFFFKSYFEHHRCAAETFSLAARKFICSESHCSNLSFYKLIHLLTHLQQVHEKSLACESALFESLSHFMEWLKKEEGQTKMKYTKALQRMKQGKLTTMWICHRFHNAMKDPTSVTGNSEAKQKVNRLNQCYSRIHAETCYNTSTSRYDGKTSIKYYPSHQHLSDSDIRSEQSLAVPVLTVNTLQESQTPVLQSFTAEEARLDPLQSVFSDAAALKQLLEGDDDFDRSKGKLDTSFDAHQLQRFEDLEKEAAAAQQMKEERLGETMYKAETSRTEDTPEEFPSDDSKTFDDDQGQDSPSLETPVKMTDKIVSEEESLPSSETSGEKLDSKENKDSGLVTLSDADLLLEKMLGESNAEESSSTTVEMETSQKDRREDEVESIGNLAPTEAKITDVDMLEAFGECITPEESSNPSITSLPQQNSVSPEQPEIDQDSETTQQESEVSETAHQEPEVQTSKHESEDEKEKDENKNSETASDICPQQPEVAKLPQSLEQPASQKMTQPEKETNEVVLEKEAAMDQVQQLEGNEQELDDDEDDDDDEESTYVLPAGIEEWGKLFALVSSHISSDGNLDEAEEARCLLSYADKITSLDMEKQIEVFNRLCTLANVQMT